MSRTMAILMCFLLPLYAQAQASDQNNDKRVYYAKRIEGQRPVIDGKLNDPVWRQIPEAGDFTQIEPHESKPPTEPTGFRIGYDNKNLYVAIRAYDSRPATITRRVARRDDGADSDLVGVIIDSYFDHRTAFLFGVNAAGVRQDEVWSRNGEVQDDSWDPVWVAEVNVDSLGWTAEIRIPLSQLRFARKKEHVWGLQVFRRLYRNQELSTWQFIPQDAPGIIHLFGELRGLSNLMPPRRLELLPYSVSKLQRFKKEPGNPFAPGQLARLNGGLDAKIGVTSDLTLDVTINPDFGQVEADPSVVNLSEFETFFEEKRPFFIEGRDILDFALMVGDGDFGRESLFYSRRIGRQPQYYPSLQAGEYSKIPENTAILGALKLSGKTEGGLSISILDAITARESAEIDFNGQRRFQTVEPFTNYFVGRIQQDYQKGATRIGGIVTATNRNLDEAHLRFLNREAYSGGVDFHHEWKDRSYFIDLRTAFSHIRGDRQALLRMQISSARYFQRPDVSHVRLDSSRTSLSGHGGYIMIGRTGKGHWRYAMGGAWRSPGLEVNDLGYLRSADRIMQFVWLQYREWTPRWIFRQFQISFNQWSGFDFAGRRLFFGGNASFSGQFKNYWNFAMGVNREFDELDATALRGGPALRTPGGFSLWYNIFSDPRRTFRVGMGGFFFNSTQPGHRQIRNVRLNLTYRPGNAVNISMNPFYSQADRNLQYIGAFTVNGAKSYLFGAIDQTTLGIVLRLNISLTPDLSIQYYGQPFISAGKYSRFKKITDPKAERYEERFHEFSAQEIRYANGGDVLEVDENGDGQVDYRFGKPDFNFKQFRSNLVIRWEYIPGSTLYLVWSQERTGYDPTGEFVFGRNFDDLFGIYPNNVFLVKISRWFSL
ncbi:MAG: DUF5916 domain-containing protein [candidate division KSB1 bacterium]|nr:DUF5916 domain-containing protein [candidate division KSB1 bacterium]